MKIHIKILTKLEILSIITKQNDFFKQYHKYLIGLSKKNINKTIDDIFKNEKNYIFEEDKDAKIFYLVCYNDNNIIALSKFIVFGNDGNNISFFNKLNIDMDKTIFIFGVFVLEKFRGMGINTKMINIIKEIANKTYKKFIIVDIKNTNTSSIRSFIKNGFIKIDIKSREPDIYFYIYS